MQEQEQPIVNSSNDLSKKEITKATEKKPSGKKSIWLSLLMNFITLGAWSRFRPRKGGWNGTWGLSLLFFLTITSTLVAERFFKSQINEQIKVTMDIEDNLLPKKWAFEDGLSIDPEIVKLQNKIDLLTTQLEAAEDINQKQLQTLSSGDDIEEIEIKLQTAIEEINYLKNLEPAIIKQIVTISPKIKNGTFVDIDSDIGCKSLYSSEKSQDLFNVNYKNHYSQWTGIISDVNNEHVTLSFGDKGSLKAMFKEKGAGYELMKNKELTVSFMHSERGNCENSFVGVDALIIK